METKDYLDYLVRVIHTTIVATVDEEGLPVTAAIDMMDTDGDSLYFMTAKGKSLYDRLKKRPFLALTGLWGDDTMTRKALSIRGKVRELGEEKKVGPVQEESVYVGDLSYRNIPKGPVGLPDL